MKLCHSRIGSCSRHIWPTCFVDVGFAGSRSGALISTAWASLVHQGEQGFMHITQQLMQVSVLSYAVLFYFLTASPFSVMAYVDHTNVVQ